MERCTLEMELFAVTARRIWLRRNSLIHENIFAHPTQLLRDARQSLEEFYRANNKAENEEPNEKDITIVKWKPLPRSMIKLNWDASLNAKDGCVGLGLIERDSQGKCLATRSMSVGAKIDVARVEAMAAANAVIFCKEMGYNNVIFEGDALQVIKAIDMEVPCMCSYGHVIESIREELHRFEKASFIHVNREANYAAHELAKLATTYVTLSTWRGDVPPSVSDIVRRELPLLYV